MEGSSTEMNDVAILLQHTFMNNNDIERRKAEETLALLSRDSNRFLDLLLGIIKQPPSTDTLVKIKEAAATYINAFIRTQIQTDIQSQPQKTYQTHAIFQTMISENVGYTLKIHLATCLTSLLSIDMSEEIKTSILPILVNAISNLSKHPNLAGLIGLQSLVTATSVGISLTNIFKETIKPLTALSTNIVTQILTDISRLSYQNPNETKEDIVNKIIENMTLLKTWSETIKNFVMKFLDKKGNLLANVTSQEALVQNFVQILCLQIPNEKQISDCIISTCGLTNFDNLCNDIKCLIMKSLNTIITFIFETRSEVELTNSKFYAFLVTAIPLIISTLTKFCKHDSVDLDSYLSLEPVEGFIVESLNFLTTVAGESEFFNIFAETKKVLFMDAILPLLRSSKNEIDLFKNSPEEFVHLALDTCDKQLSETYKTAAAKFMEILCDRIDGSLTFIAIISLQLINFSLVSDQIADIPTKFSVLSEFVDSIFITKTPATIRVETCITVLSILSYLIPRRADLMTLMEQTFHAYHQFFLNQKCDSLIRSRVCLLIGYYAENIFQDEIKYKDMYAMHIKFLVECVGLQDSANLPVALQAIDSLNNIFEDEDLYPRMNKFINEILFKFSEFIIFMRHNEFYDIIQEIVKTYAQTIAENRNLVVSIITMLVNKILSELKSLENTSENNNIIINKCWNIIRAMAEMKAYVKYQTEIESALGPLFAYMENPSKIDFDDDILLLINSFIKKTNKISEISWKLFATFPKFFEKYHGMFGNLFTTLNLFIIHGKSVFREHIEYLDIIIQMGIEGLFCKAKNVNEANYAESAVLFHLILYYYGDILPADRWERIFSTTIERLGKEVKKSFLRARLLGVFLCGFYKNYQLSQDILTLQNQLAPILNDILNRMTEFSHLYDRKLFIFGLTSILTQGQLQSTVSDKFVQIFDSIITMLKFIQYVESTQQKKKKMNNDSDDEDNEITNESEAFEKFLSQSQNNVTGTQRNMQFEDEKMEEDDDDDDDEDDDDDDDDEGGYFAENDEVEAKLTVDSLKIDLKTEDEFDYFKKVIYAIKEKNPAGLKQIIDQLVVNKQNYLRDVLQSQRILVNKDDKKYVARKIIKIKQAKHTPVSLSLATNQSK